jgi:hypothetical protein
MPFNGASMIFRIPQNAADQLAIVMIRFQPSLKGFSLGFLDPPYSLREPDL